MWNIPQAITGAIYLKFNWSWLWHKLFSDEEDSTDVVIIVWEQANHSSLNGALIWFYYVALPSIKLEGLQPSPFGPQTIPRWTFPEAAWLRLMDWPVARLEQVSCCKSLNTQGRYGSCKPDGEQVERKEDDLEKKAFKLELASCGDQQHAMEFCREWVCEWAWEKKRGGKVRDQAKTANLTLPCGFVILNT